MPFALILRPHAPTRSRRWPSARRSSPEDVGPTWVVHLDTRDGEFATRGELAAHNHFLTQRIHEDVRRGGEKDHLLITQAEPERGLVDHFHHSPELYQL